MKLIKFLFLFIFSNLVTAEVEYKIGLGSCNNQNYPTPAWDALEEENLDAPGEEDGDVDNDGDSDQSDAFLMKKRKAIKKAMAKEGVELPDYVIEAIEEVLAEDEDYVIESEDLDASSASKALTHDCAKHVVHKEHGEGQCVPGMHTLEEDEDNPGTGYVTHYDVMFGDSIVEDVPVEELEIVSEMSHGHPKKKKK